MRRAAGVIFGVLAGRCAVVGSKRKPRAASGLLALGIALSGAYPAAAVSPPLLVADLGGVVRPDGGSVPHGFAPIAPLVVFAAQPDDYADRLFVTDGSGAGTREIAALCPPRVAGSSRLLFRDPTRAFYRAFCADGSVTLWGTDGTTAGTRPLLVLAEPGSGADQDAGGAETNPDAWVELEGKTYFLLGGRSAPLELWKSDGTVAGTTLVRALDEISGETYIGICAAADGKLALAAYTASPSGEWEILFWQSDGTAGGTLLGRRIPTTAGGFSFPRLGRLEAGIALWMRGENDSTSELWFSDGSDAGTTQLAVFHASNSWADAIAGWKADGRSLYFIATTDGRRSIWRSDLTPESTRPIVDAGGWKRECAGSRRSRRSAGRPPVLQAATPSNASSGGLRSRVAPGEPLPGGCGAAPCDPIDPAADRCRGSGIGSCFAPPRLERSALWASDGDDAPAQELALLCDDVDCWRQYYTAPGVRERLRLRNFARMAPRRTTSGSRMGGPRGPIASRKGSKNWRSGCRIRVRFWRLWPDPGWVFRASGGGVGLELGGRIARPTRPPCWRICAGTGPV